MENPSKLYLGDVPAKTICPYKEKCPHVKPKNKNLWVCNHLGEDHPIGFNCRIARGFDLLQRKNVIN